MDINKTIGKETIWHVYKKAVRCIEFIQETVPYKKAAVFIYLSSYKSFSREKNKAFMEKMSLSVHYLH